MRKLIAILSISVGTLVSAPSLLASDWSDWNVFACCNGFETDWERQIRVVPSNNCDRIEWRVRAVARDDLLAELNAINITCRGGDTVELTGPDFHTKLASFANIPVGETRSYRSECLCRGQDGIASATWEDEVDWNMPTPDDYPY